MKPEIPFSSFSMTTVHPCLSANSRQAIRCIGISSFTRSTCFFVDTRYKFATLFIMYAFLMYKCRKALTTIPFSKTTQFFLRLYYTAFFSARQRCRWSAPCIFSYYSVLILLACRFMFFFLMLYRTFQNFLLFWY